MLELYPRLREGYNFRNPDFYVPRVKANRYLQRTTLSKFYMLISFKNVPKKLASLGMLEKLTTI